MAKELSQEEFDAATETCAAVAMHPDRYSRDQVKFAARLAERLARDGLQTLTTYVQHRTLAEIRARTAEAPKAGHNSQVAGHVAGLGAPFGEELRRHFDRIQRLNAEIAALNADKSDVFQEVKARGFDLAVFRTVLSRAQQQRQDVQERDAMIRLYEEAIFGGEGQA